MAKECKVFRSDSGKTFDTLFEALVDDFHTLVLSKCGNEAITRQVVQGLTSPAEALDEFAAIVTALVANRTEHSVVAAPQFGDIRDGMTAEQLEALYAGPSIRENSTAGVR